MNERDDAIDTVMTALRAAEPSAGFEARLHQALQQGVVRRHTRRVRFALTASVALLLCAIAIGFGLHTHPADHAVAVQRPRPMPAPRLVTAGTQVSEVRAQRSPGRVHAAKIVRLTALSDPDADGTMAHVNMPPPPLPLTQEERLVIRMMRHNDLPQLAVLSADARARSLHEDAEAYRAFFAPRPPLEGQPIYHQHIISGGSQ